MRLKKIIGIIHLWLGLSSGLVVFILGITGCIYVFHTELKDLIYAERYLVDERGKSALPISLLKAKAQAALGEEYPITFMYFDPNSHSTYRFRASKVDKEAITYNSSVKYNKTAFVNPYNAKVQYVENTKWEFFNIVLKLHYDLLLNKIGHQIIGWSTVIFVIMLITGLVLWWPKNKKALKQRVSFKWKNTTKWKRKNYDLHNIPGFYIMLVALCISLSGLYFAFEWFKEPVKWIANGGKPLAEAQKLKLDTTKNKTASSIDLIEQSVKNKSLKAGFYHMTFPEDKTAPIVVTAMLNDDNFARRSQFFYDRNTGEELKTNLYEMQSNAEKLNFMVYDIHVGKILGLPGQILVFLGGLVAASLPVTGFLIWYGRKFKNKKKTVTQKRIKPKNETARSFAIRSIF